MGRGRPGRHPVTMALADEAVMSACFEAAREHPFHRERLRGIADCCAAPAIDKCDLLPALRAFSVHDEPLGVYLVRSGGSTQAPLIFPVDIGENNAQRAALAGRLREAGVFGPRTVALNVFGYADLYRTAAILDDLLERCAATALPLSAHARYEDMYAAALRFRPTHLLGTPSKLALFGHFLAASAQPLQIPQLLYGGEVLRDTTREVLRDAFGTQQIWSLYGGAESGIWAWCDATRRPASSKLCRRWRWRSSIPTLTATARLQSATVSGVASRCSAIDPVTSDGSSPSTASVTSRCAVATPARSSLTS